MFLMYTYTCARYTKKISHKENFRKIILINMTILIIRNETYNQILHILRLMKHTVRKIESAS